MYSKSFRKKEEFVYVFRGYVLAEWFESGV